MQLEQNTERSAFLLNANAKNVTDRVLKDLVGVIPAGDLYYARSMEDSEAFLRTILKRGYKRVITGGGDGTLVVTMNLLQKIMEEENVRQKPAMGVLKLGTGNAMATALGASHAINDVHQVMDQNDKDHRELHMVECDDGTLTPFAGMGYDGEILNDYFELKKATEGTAMDILTKTAAGYVLAAISRTVPRQFNRQLPSVTVTTKDWALKLVENEAGEIQEVSVPPGTLLYRGPAPMLSVGAIPYYGYGFTMFPFAERKPGFVQLRVCAVPVRELLTNLYPSIWKGDFRHEKLHDWLIKDVEVVADVPLPYQVGGDAWGEKSHLRFKAASEAWQMVDFSGCAA
jgi:diacylglycerol kinase family enzyme